MKRKLPVSLDTTALTLVCAAPSALAQPQAGPELPDPSTYDAAIAWLPYTQYYSESYPEHFDAQTKWLADNAAKRKIGDATHTGDIVDNGDDKAQWENASKSLKTLEEVKFPTAWSRATTTSMVSTATTSVSPGSPTRRCMANRTRTTAALRHDRRRR